MSFDWNIKDKKLGAALSNGAEHKSPYLVLADIGDVIAQKTHNILYTVLNEGRMFDASGRLSDEVHVVMAIFSNLRADAEGTNLGGDLLHIYYKYKQPWPLLRLTVFPPPRQNDAGIWVTEGGTLHPIYDKYTISNPTVLEKVVAEVLELDEIDQWLASLVNPEAR